MTKRLFVPLKTSTSDCSLLADNISTKTNHSVAKSWRSYRLFGEKIRRIESPPITRRFRKRDRLKAMFMRCSNRDLDDDIEVGSLIFDLEREENTPNVDLGNSDESLFNAMQETRSNTLFNRFRTGRKSYSDTENAGDSLRMLGALKMQSGSKRLSSKSIRERIRLRLAKETQKPNGLSESLFEIPSELTKTIASCVLDNRSFVSTEDSSLGNLDLKVDQPQLTYTPQSKTDSRNEPTTDESLGFTPRYQHAFQIEPPPKNLPKQLHAKWERSQMFKYTARNYDHEKWKSKQLLLNQENISDEEKVNTEHTITIRSSNKDGDNVSTNLFENMGRLFIPKNSSKVSNCSPSSTKSFFDTTKLFLPTTPKVGNLSNIFSFKNRIVSGNSLSSRFNSMASSDNSPSTISSSRSACKISVITHKNFNYTENYSLYSQDTFFRRKTKKYVNNNQKQLQDETFSEFSF